MTSGLHTSDARQPDHAGGLPRPAVAAPGGERSLPGHRRLPRTSSGRWRPCRPSRSERPGRPAHAPRALLGRPHGSARGPDPRLGLAPHRASRGLALGQAHRGAGRLALLRRRRTPSPSTGAWRASTSRRWSGGRGCSRSATPGSRSAGSPTCWWWSPTSTACTPSTCRGRFPRSHETSQLDQLAAALRARGTVPFLDLRETLARAGRTSADLPSNRYPLERRRCLRGVPGDPRRRWRLACLRWRPSARGGSRARADDARSRAGRASSG